MTRSESGCDLCNESKTSQYSTAGKSIVHGLMEAIGIKGRVSTEHGFFIVDNVLYYEHGKLGTEGIIIHYCPACGRELTEGESV